MTTGSPVSSRSVREEETMLNAGDSVKTTRGQTVKILYISGGLVKGILDDAIISTWLLNGESLHLGIPDLDLTAVTEPVVPVWSCLNHTPIDTGMAVSWCRVCDRKLRFTFPEWIEAAEVLDNKDS